MMDIPDLLWGGLALIVGFLHQRNESRFDKIENKIDNSVTKDDFRHILDAKLEPINVKLDIQTETIDEIKQDVKELRDK